MFLSLHHFFRYLRALNWVDALPQGLFLSQGLVSWCVYPSQSMSVIVLHARWVGVVLSLSAFVLSALRTTPSMRIGFSNQVSYGTSWKMAAVLGIDMFNTAKQDGYHRGRCSASEGLGVGGAAFVLLCLREKTQIFKKIKNHSETYLRCKETPKE